MSITKVYGSGLPEAKAINIDKFFEYAKGQDEAPSNAKLYRSVSWVYRCIKLRSGTLADIPVQIKRNDKETDAYSKLITKALLRDIESDLCIYGAAYLLRNKPRSATSNLQRLNPATMHVKTSPTKGVTGFEQAAENGVIAYKPEDIIYIRDYNPGDDLGPGIAPLTVAMEAAGISYSANRWSSRFFAHGAIPAVILTTEQNIADNELERVGSAWKRLTQGVERAWRTIILRRGLKAQVVGQPVKDLALNELMESVRGQIANAFGVPETMLADAANYATAKEHRLGFYQDTILPQSNIIEGAFNDQMFYELGLELCFNTGSIEALQKDEADKAGYIVLLLQADAITIDEAREQMGFDPLTPEQRAELEPEPQPIPQAPQEEDEPEPVKPSTYVEKRTDLDRWQSKALKRYDEGRPDKALEFDSDEIPATRHAAIVGALEACESVDDVKLVFMQAKEWEGYP